jgi:hypothetical protein
MGSCSRYGCEYLQVIANIRYIPAQVQICNTTRAGKSLAEVDLSGAVVVSVDHDSQTAKDRSRYFVGLYLAPYFPVNHA